MKIFLGLIISLLMVSTQLTHAAGVAYWPADGTADDVLGDNHGVLRNGATFGQGIAAQAFSFDGADDFVEVPDSNDWAFGNGNFSIALWTRLGSSPPNDNYRMLMSQADNGDSFFHFYLDRTTVINPNPSLTFDMRNAGTTVIRMSPDYIPPTDRWIHFAFVRENNVARLYVDGNPYATGAISGSVPDLSSSLVFGYDKLNNRAWLNGLMDDIHLFNHAISPQEVQQLAGIPEPNTVTLVLICAALSAFCRRRNNVSC